MMMERRPLIIVTGPDKGGYVAWFFTRLSIWMAGGRAKRVRPKSWRRISKHLKFDGLVLGGGADVDPKRYGETLLHSLEEEVHSTPTISFRRFAALFKAVLVYILRFIFSWKHSGFLDKARDDVELALLDHAIEEGIPVLGICRGCQLINVYYRGNLHQTIKDFYVEYPQYRSVLPKKLIHIEEDSRLRGIINQEQCIVNALHNQAVNMLSPALRVAAREGNGIVQAIESMNSSTHLLGVQWHPEYLVQKREQRAIFRWLIEQASENRAYRGRYHHAASFIPTQS